MSIRHLLLITLTLVVVAAPSPALARQAPASVSQAAMATETFTIDAIDYKGRLVTLRDADGQTETILCGPEVQRFDALKAGDKVTFKYYESVVYEITKPGAAPKATVAGGVTRTAGTRPGGTIAQTQTAVVTVNEIDLKAPSVTVTTSDGRTMGFKVEDVTNLQGVKVGDQVQITFTQALAISVTSAGQ